MDTDKKNQITQTLEQMAKRHEEEAALLRSLISYIRHPHGG